MTAFTWLLLGGCTLTVGDIVFKFWTKTPTRPLYIIGLVIYLAGLIFFVESLKSENIVIASAVLVIANLVTLAVVSWFYFGEKLTGLQMFGVMLAIIAVSILETKIQ